MTDVDTRKPVESMLSLLRGIKQLHLAMDLPRQKAALASFRAMSREEKSELIGLMMRADELHAFLLRMFLDDALDGDSLRMSRGSHVTEP